MTSPDNMKSAQHFPTRAFERNPHTHGPAAKPGLGHTEHDGNIPKSRRDRYSCSLGGCSRYTIGRAARRTTLCFCIVFGARTTPKDSWTGSGADNQRSRPCTGRATEAAASYRSGWTRGSLGLMVSVEKVGVRCASRRAAPATWLMGRREPGWLPFDGARHGHRRWSGRPGFRLCIRISCSTRAFLKGSD